MVLSLKRWKSRSSPGIEARATCIHTHIQNPFTNVSYTLRLPTQTVAGWSSPVARQAHNLKVTGSNPVPATKTTKAPGPQPGAFVRSRYTPLRRCAAGNSAAGTAHRVAKWGMFTPRVRLDCAIGFSMAQSGSLPLGSLLFGCQIGIRFADIMDAKQFVVGAHRNDVRWHSCFDLFRICSSALNSWSLAVI